MQQAGNDLPIGVFAVPAERYVRRKMMPELIDHVVV